MTANSNSFAGKWWIYQQERFPVIAHGLLIAAFSFCAVSLSRTLRGQPGWPQWPQLMVAFGTCFIFFLQLRIADEFKDFQEDARYRPYRPVQRGLVTLRELGALFAAGALLQLLLALWLDPRLVILLAITWAYLAGMSKEFFVADWLRQKPILYTLSHMMIMPLVDLYATSTDWLTAGTHAPRGLFLFLLASYFNGLAIEIGRKIRSPLDEEPGVITYSHLWGRPIATSIWWTTMAIVLLMAVAVAWQMQITLAVVLMLSTMFATAIVIGSWFVTQPIPGRGKWIEHFSGLWTLALYLSLGLLPHSIGRGIH